MQKLIGAKKAPIFILQIFIRVMGTANTKRKWKTRNYVDLALLVGFVLTILVIGWFLLEDLSHLK